MAALKRFKHPEIPVAAVATGFPSGQYSLNTRLEEIKMAIAAGAKEIDIVINRKMALNQQWEELYEEVKRFKFVPIDCFFYDVFFFFLRSRP